MTVGKDAEEAMTEAQTPTHICNEHVGVTYIFEDHKPTEGQIYQIKLIRWCAMELARAIQMNCPECADRTVALRKLREAVMFANASIVLKGASVR